MDNDRFSDLMSWLMLNTMNTAVLFSQQQKQRPLTTEEIEECQSETMRCAEVLRAGYRDGLADALHAGG